jgi:RHS repeat-associated protein
MQSALSQAFSEPLLAAMPQLSEKPHQGVPSSNPALHLGHEVSKSTTALGLRAALHLERVKSRYTGKERDAESGNDYFGARYYASSMGRWLSPDPGWFMFANMNNPQSLNLYSHALNSPLVWIDIDGLELVTVVTASGQRVVVDRSIAGDVISLVRAANNHGLMVTITSGFRSTQHQADMYNKWLASGKKGNPVGKPGGSGHNSGQAIDIHTSNLSQNDRFILGSIGLQYGLPYAGSQDTVHFGAGFGNPVDSQLVIENNANPNPDSTIVDGGVTTVNVTDSGTQIDTDNSTVIPDQITPIDTQNLDLTPQPLPPPPPPQDQQNQQ